MTDTLIRFCGFDCRIQEHHYQNKRLAIQLVDAVDGGPVAMATVNLPEEEVPEGHILVKNYSENTGMAEALEKAGVATRVRSLLIGPFAVEVVLMKYANT